MTDKPSHIVAAACIVASAAGLAEFSILTVLANLNVSRMSLRIQNSTITGIVSGALVWALLVMVSLRRQYLRRKLYVVAELNHELRNALEVILHAEYLALDERHAALHDSAERLNKVLTELLEETRATLRSSLL
jgi:signal transduction histidine kinase